MLDLRTDKLYEISFLKINFVLEKARTSTTIVQVQSNLIDRSGFNPLRTVSFAIAEVGSRQCLIEPAQKIFYKLRGTDFKTPVFKIYCPSTDETIPFTEISVQIKIRESDGWV